MLFQLMGIVFLSVIFGSMVLWSRAFGHWTSGTPLIANAEVSRRFPRQRAPWDIAVDIAFLFIVWGLAMVIPLEIGAWLGWYPRGTEMENLSGMEQVRLLIASGLGSVLLFFAVVSWLMLRGAKLTDLGIDLRHFRNDCVLGLSGFVMLAPLLYGLQWALSKFFDEKHPLVNMAESNPSAEFFVAAGVIAVVIAPTVEELMFRVVLQGWIESLADWFFGVEEEIPTQSAVSDEPAGLESSGLESSGPLNPFLPTKQIVGINLESLHDNEHRNYSRNRRLSWIASVLGSSLLFAAAHWGHGAAPFALFFFALGLGHLFYSTRRLLPSIVMHASLNATSMLMLIASTKMPK